jgi:hypothetical protein
VVQVEASWPNKSVVWLTRHSSHVIWLHVLLILQYGTLVVNHHAEHLLNTCRRTLFDACPKFNVFIHSVINGTRPPVRLPLDAEDDRQPEEREMMFFSAADGDDMEDSMLPSTKRSARTATAAGSGKRPKTR